MNAVPLDGTELLSFAASLLVVIGTIVVLGWLYARNRAVGGGHGDAINIVASRALGSRERLLIVEVAGVQLLVGLTSSDVRTLHVFDAPVIEERALAEVSGFGGRLQSAIRRMRR